MSLSCYHADVLRVPLLSAVLPIEITLREAQEDPQALTDRLLWVGHRDSDPLHVATHDHHHGDIGAAGEEAHAGATVEEETEGTDDQLRGQGQGHDPHGGVVHARTLLGPGQEPLPDVAQVAAVVLTEGASPHPVVEVEGEVVDRVAEDEARVIVHMTAAAIEAAAEAVVTVEIGDNGLKVWEGTVYK